MDNKLEDLRYFRVVGEDGKLMKKVFKGKRPKDAAEAAFISLIGDKKTGTLTYVIAEKVNDEYKKAQYTGTKETNSGKGENQDPYLITVKRVTQIGGGEKKKDEPVAGKRKSRSKSPSKAKKEPNKTKPKEKKPETKKSKSSGPPARKRSVSPKKQTKKPSKTPRSVSPKKQTKKPSKTPRSVSPKGAVKKKPASKKTMK